MLLDALEENRAGVVAEPLREEVGGAVAGDRAVLEREARGTWRSSTSPSRRTGDPDADPLVRLVRRLRVALEDRAEVRADRVGGDVLGELVADDLLVGLIDLDDLFDVALDVACEEALDEVWLMHLLLEDLRSVVVLGVEDAHEAQARGAVELTGVEEDGGHVHLALQLLEQ